MAAAFASVLLTLSGAADAGNDQSLAAGLVPWVKGELGAIEKATIVAVSDGDSFTARTLDGLQIGVRIHGIDAPERGQPYAEAARTSLRGLLRGHQITIQTLKRDPYGRHVSRVYADGQDVALAQIEAGLAWHYTLFLNEQNREERLRYGRAQVEARAARQGLWAEPAPEEPWQHRARQRNRLKPMF